MSIIGKILRVSTFGESHSTAVGCIIEGFPSNFTIDFSQVQKQMNRRKPGQSSITTSRKQMDKLQILSGIQNNITLGSPICLLVKNQDFRKGDYKKFLKTPRPGHADYTYKMKYGIMSESGGGRSSARETVGRVLAGALCKQYLGKLGIYCSSWVYSVGSIQMKDDQVDQKSIIHLHKDGFSAQGGFYDLRGAKIQSLVSDIQQTHMTRCPHQQTSIKMINKIKQTKQDQDSIGGVVQGCIYNVPIGLGRPVFDKFPSLISRAMMSIPATKGFQFGSGFNGTKLLGSQHNDKFQMDNNMLRLKTNNSGGTLGGITTGSTFHFKVAFKPVSTIGKKQYTTDYQGNQVELEGHGRHDPCVLPRAPPIVDSMAALTTMDQLLQLNCYK